MRTNRTERCDCGGIVPAETGPVHAYLHSAPACWRMYGELSVGLPSGADAAGLVAPIHVDCYAAQHTRSMETDRRQRSSVCVHLVALCLHLEHAVGAEHLARYRGRASATVHRALGLVEWPLLDPPVDYGPITAADLHAAGVAERARLAARWPASVWSAWEPVQPAVREWADVLLAGSR